MNGDRWIGPGHNAVVTDTSGQDWFVYHAVNRADPDFGTNTSYTKRPAHLDRLTWTADGADSWPVVQRDSDRDYLKEDAPVTLVESHSDDFDGKSAADWDWAGDNVPAPGTYGPGTLGYDGKSFAFALQNADLWQGRNDASVYAQAAPAGDYMVEARVHLPLPASATNYNYAQAGLVIYGDDDNYVKLTHVAIGVTRQTEFGKEVGGRYGNGVGGPPSDWTYLRIVRRVYPNAIDPAGVDEELYTAYTTSQSDASGQPINWLRAGTWTHALGASSRIGLVAMSNGSGTPFTANFDYVRVSTVATVAP